MATKRRRGDAWQYIVKRAGLLPRPLYLTFDDEAEGDAYVRRLEAQLDRGVLPDIVAKALDLRSGVARYLSAVHVTTDDARILRVAMERLDSGVRLEQLDFAWAQGWVTRMKREDNLSPSTVRHYVGALARALDWLLAHGELQVNPLRQLARGYATYTQADAVAAARDGGARKVDSERDRRLEADEEAEIRRILAYGKPHGRERAFELHFQPSLALMFDMALESAMRLREMATLLRSQVDLRRATIFLERTKNGRRRQVPITSVLAPLVEAYMGAHDFEGRLFPWLQGDATPARQKLVSDRLSRQWGRIFDAAGAPDLHFHDLRHEAISRIYERTTLTDVEVANITGHTDLRMLKRYANLRGSTLAARLW